MRIYHVWLHTKRKYAEKRLEDIRLCECLWECRLFVDNKVGDRYSQLNAVGRETISTWMW